MSKTDFQNGFALGMASGGAVEVEKPVPENAVYTILEYSDVGYPKKVKYQVPEGLDNTTIPAYAFGKYTGSPNEMCKYIEEIEIPETVTALGNFAFSSCGYLKSVSNYDNLVNIGMGAISTGYKRWELKYLPPNIESIGESAFNSGVAFWSTITIPASVKSIGKRAFYGCNNEVVIFKGTPESLTTETFVAAASTDIYVPWAEGEVANAPWGATNATIHYNYVEGEETNAEG